MSPKLVYTAAAVAAALSLAVMPADAQDRRGGRRERARAEQGGGGDGERQDGGRRAVPRSSVSRQESPARQAPRYEESRQAAAPQQAPEFSQRRRDQAAQDGSRSNQARANTGSQYSTVEARRSGIRRRRCLAERATADKINAPRHAGMARPADTSRRGHATTIGAGTHSLEAPMVATATGATSGLRTSSRTGRTTSRGHTTGSARTFTSGSACGSARRCRIRGRTSAPTGRASTGSTDHWVYVGVAPALQLYGGVSFDIQPSDADLFVDGEYVGSVGTFTPYGEPLTLWPGVHRIAIVRDGFRTMEWEVAVQPGQVIPYRGMLAR